jgi:defect in organelle trafficking protein DotC
MTRPKKRGLRAVLCAALAALLCAVVAPAPSARAGASLFDDIFWPVSEVVDGSTDENVKRTPSRNARSDAWKPPSANMVDDALARPPTLKQLQDVPDAPPLDGDDRPDDSLPLQIRADALKEAAISYGARGGLAMRTWEIRRELVQRARYLDRIYDFRALLIPAPSGFLIEPPVVSEAMNATIIDSGGQEAAVSDRIYAIIANAQIVSAARTWRGYLERQWGAVEPPPDILYPRDRAERRIWEEYVEKGWAEGYAQAEEIFEDDLNRLTADFRGMVRYRMLLAQGMISPPYALQTDRGVTGGGDEMRVGDRAIAITGTPQLIPGADQWTPASR